MICRAHHRSGERCSRAAAAVIVAVLLGVVSAGCGGDDGGGTVVVIVDEAPTPTPTPRVLGTPATGGEAARELAAELVLANVAAILALGPGVPSAATGGGGAAASPLGTAARAVLGGEPAMGDGNVAAVASAQTGSGACPLGGSLVATCTERGSATSLAASFSSCALLDDESGNRVVLTGSAEFVIPRRGICSTGVVPAEVVLTVHAQSLEQAIFDPAGRELTRLMFRGYSEVSEPLGRGCGGPQRRLRFSGEITIYRRSVSTWITIEGHEVRFESRSDGVRCVRRVEVSGPYSVQAASLASDQRVEWLRLALPLDEGAAAVEVEARLETSCAGVIEAVTLEPLVLPIERSCPSAGVLAVTAGGGQSRARATATGGLEHDLDADGTVDVVRLECNASVPAICDLPE
jgi:hypothetical protein